MDNTNNPADTVADKSKPKSKGCLKWALIILAVIILLIAAVPIAFEIVDHIPRTKDTKTNGQYTVELQQSQLDYMYNKMMIDSVFTAREQALQDDHFWK